MEFVWRSRPNPAAMSKSKAYSFILILLSFLLIH
jgi:hypothetical protein